MIQRSRWILWLPVLLGLGIGLYFSLHFEPPLYIGVSATLVFAGLSYGLRAKNGLSMLFLALFVVALGLSVATFRTWWVAAPTLSAETGPVRLSGQVERLEVLHTGLRVTLGNLTISRLGPDFTPKFVRVKLTGREQPQFQPGDWLEMRANLRPPPAPAMPGAFDFQRQSYFQAIGGVGFSYGPPSVIGRAPENGIDSLRFAFQRLRLHMAMVIQSQLGGEVGHVAAALMTGQRGTIGDSVMDDMRASGLAHLLAISGLHVGLIAGLIFFAVRAGCALVPSVALRYPIKKWAAVASIVAAFGYAMLAGATVPTQRAFMMVALVLLAVLFDRKAVSMRLVMWAALLILLLSPESLLGASFQMSFSAVVALVAVYEGLKHSGMFAKPARTFWGRVGRYVLGVVVSTAVAGAATGVFAAFHFNRVADFGLAANIIAVPITALWIMPWAIVAYVLMPLGLEDLALVPMGWGIEAVLLTAHEVASWPGSITLVPAFPVWGLACVVLGGLWLALWQGWFRALGLPMVMAGGVALMISDSPDVLIHSNGKMAAVADGDGGYAFSTLSSAKFERAIWQRRAGQDDDGKRWSDMAQNSQQLSCDGLGCIYRLGKHTVAFSATEDAQMEDCAMAQVVVVEQPIESCRYSNYMISKDELSYWGTHGVWLSKDETVLRIETVNGQRGQRPWVVQGAD
ncbi:MAG: ComEC family competence protein [Magnetovibrio sp.]|nr:ComEC family competence protein [Magnetovibrio sp.]